MKILNTTVLAAAMLLSGVVMAEGYEYESGTSSTAVSVSDSKSLGVGQAGNSFDQTFDSHNEATDLGRSVPNPYAPALTTTLTETCMGSTSFGGTGVGFGFSFGTTWRDTACVRRLDSRQMAMLGDAAVAREIMCDSALVREAALRAGRPCGVKVVAPAAPVAQRVLPRQAAPAVEKRVGG